MGVEVADEFPPEKVYGHSNLQQTTASANNIHLAWTSAGVVESGKYLGVTISKICNGPTIYTKIGKATRTLGFLRQINLGHCTPSVKL